MSFQCTTKNTISCTPAVADADAPTLGFENPAGHVRGLTGRKPRQHIRHVFRGEVVEAAILRLLHPLGHLGDRCRHPGTRRWRHRVRRDAVATQFRRLVERQCGYTRFCSRVVGLTNGALQSGAGSRIDNTRIDFSTFF